MSSSTKPHDERRGRTLPERITLGVSVAVLCVLLAGLVALQVHQGSAAPPAIRVEPDFARLRSDHGQWYLPVEVTNTGDEPTDLVRATLQLDAEPGELPAESELEFTFVAGGETVAGVAIFDDRPTPETLTAGASAYTEP